MSPAQCSRQEQTNVTQVVGWGGGEGVMEKVVAAGKGGLVCSLLPQKGTESSESA